MSSGIGSNEYANMVKKASPPSHGGKNFLWAFLSGGGICCLGQFLCELWQQIGFSLPQARGMTSVTLIFFTAILTLYHVFDDIARHTGAGTLVPITGFANSMVSPAMEFRREGFIAGAGAKMFSIAGPVLVYGISASVLYGLVLWSISYLM